MKRTLAITLEQGATGELCVCCGRGGEGEVKSGAVAGGADGPQAAAMRLDDGATDGQAHAGTVILGGKECLEDLFGLLG